MAGGGLAGVAALVTEPERAPDSMVPMRLPNNPRRERLAIWLVVIGAPAGLIAPAAFENVEIVAIPVMLFSVGSLVLALIYVRKLPRLVFSGLIGGGIVGLIILGGGSRLAMRIVALTGGRREVTIEGTAFLMVFGAFAGANIGVFLAALRRVVRPRIGPTAVVLGLLGVLAFVGPRDIREELVHEGRGIWLNAPMFLSLLPLYGWAALSVIPVVARRLPGKGWGRQLEQSAPTAMATSS